ncbi:MAG TPA: trypsin-like peptidase domain-containing protein [Tepidisphaeraceae bacterium]|jgi:S1-C subfamily serine protease
MRTLLIRSCVLSLLVPAVLWAGKLKMKDGTVYEGTIKKLGSSYTVKLDDGTMKIVSAGDVASVDDPALNGPATPAGGATSGGASATGSADFDRTVRQADRVDTPLFAVTLWQKFVDTHPNDPDNAKGKAELKKWQDMARDGAEKVKGKWVSGEELKKLHKQVDQMTEEAVTMLRGDQTLKGVEKLKEILKIYPNSFPANFEMGYYSLVKISRVEGSNKLIDDSIASLETAAKLKPNSPEALTNLAIAYNFRKKYEDAVVSAYKAAQLNDSKEIVQNLYNALENAPPGMLRNNPKVVPIVSDAKVLFSRRGASSNTQWTYVRPDYRKPKSGESSPGDLARKGVVGSGTGFFISDDGYIMTNRHVAAAGDKMIIRMSDGTTKVAEKIIVDDEQDIAILKIVNEPKTPLPFIRLADYDAPNIGTDVTVMGFPLGGMMGMNVKITRGVVTAVEDGKQECDVIVDAQVNPGNSGGPMLDKYGNLLALVAMKTLSDEAISSYGLGISTGRLRKFFEHQKEKLTSVKLTKAEKAMPTAVLTTEEIAQKFTKATVMVLIVAGELPEGLK